MKQLFPRKNLGFSLIELLVFIAVMGLFSAAMIRLLAGFSDGYNKPMLRATVIQKAQSLLENISLQDYSQIKLRTSEKVEDIGGISFSINVLHAGEQFKISSNQVKYISVEVYYKNSQTFALSTYRFNY